MESIVQKKIKNFLDSTGLSVPALERKAGLKLNVARNILLGKSKKPSANTLQAIATVMDCTVQDLLGVKSELLNSDSSLSKESPLLEYPELLNEALQTILKVAIENDYKLTVKQTLLILEEVYSYSIKKDIPGIDKDFIEWFVGRTIE